MAYIQSLNGMWQVAVDANNAGRLQRWFDDPRLDSRAVPVPGIVQQVFPTHQGVAWYWRVFAPDTLPAASERAVLRFGAVEYLAEVWLNGEPVGGHEGAEMPFELDVTRALRAGDNLLAVRVLKPGKERIDGFVLDEIPHRNQYDHTDFRPGMSYNVSGLTGPVALAVAPGTRIADVCVVADPASGRVAVTVEIHSDQDGAPAYPLRLVIAPAAGGDLLAEAEGPVSPPPGDSTWTFDLGIDRPHLWSLDDPYLYRVTASLAGHERSARFGFRDFRVVDGFFHLNGKRLFLRSSHTGNHFPIGQIVPPDPGLMRRDFLMAKAAGFNCIRFIAGAAWPEQLDLCDEIGLMVYEESYASWVLGDSPYIAERYGRSYAEMIRRDRNHPCVVIWGLINEMTDGPAFRCAVDYLPALRALDPTRLVLLASGRWDARPAIGSVSNPGSTAWEPAWGVEGTDAPDIDSRLTWEPGGYVDRAGDAHVYPTYPLEERFARLVRTLGQSSKPVFLSEYGIGSLMNVVEEARGYDRYDAPDDLADRALIRQMAERLVADLKRYGLDEVYPFPADLLRESYRLHSFQRRLAFDLIRSNPQLSGYNLTGLLDHGITGEGLWSFWRRWKPGIVEALEDGWSPLRWCLFVSPAYAYRRQPIEIEAVLASEDALAPGTYPVCFRIWGEGRLAWERRAEVRIPAAGPGERPPLAVPVLKARLRIDLPAGDYVLAADLERGGAPTGDRLPFRVASDDTARPARRALAVWGIPQRTRTWLEARGFACRPYDPEAGRAPAVVLVGAPAGGPLAAGAWAALRRHVEQGGACAVLASAGPFRAASIDSREVVPAQSLPWGGDLKARRFHDWLYHKDVVARRHPVFDGLPAGGILDWYVYGHVMSGDVFDCPDGAVEVIAASFAAGYSCPGGYDSAIAVGVETVGKGCLLFNSLRALDHLGRHPAADQLLTNLLRHAQEMR